MLCIDFGTRQRAATPSLFDAPGTEALDFALEQNSTLTLTYQ